ncbi:hypothetical protein MMC18_007468 [Xylographa bjoerkii]|nr:hypothetical protein [Xylographa bjoerkii]MCJ1394502.1 hypothetical protein [Xylographa bjoerkii]MCJ1394588.1 hypothetical protein [Xylographa bjoerkii]
MLFSAHVTLSPDTVDDILYFARTNSVSDLSDLLSFTAIAHNTTPSTILLNVHDPDTHNGPLHMAAANGHTETIHLLLSYNPPVLPSETPVSPSNHAPSSTPALHPLILTCNLAGNTALHYACLNGHLEAAKVLLAAGADPTIVNNAGHDAIYEAEANGKEEVSRWVLMEGKGLEKAVGSGDIKGSRSAEGEEDGEEEEARERKDRENGVKEQMEGLGIGEKP